MSKFLRGMVLGLAVGAGVVLFLNPPDKKGIKTIKRRAVKTLQKLENAVDDLCCKLN